MRSGDRLARYSGLEIVGPRWLSAALLLLGPHQMLLATTGKHTRMVDAVVTTSTLRPGRIAQQLDDGG
ncbi:MAG TPA: hypothetical protein VNP04_15825 [Alphaproteobacteria bacterium]|nr:hypothetical protein [Alphaproteobacteria bacterium]